jgi:hypothetical protein
MGDSPSILGRLYLQELRALTRGRFVLVGAAALAAFVGFMAAVPATDAGNGLRDFVAASAFILPQIVGLLAAVVFASDRSSGFLDAVLTTPVRGSTFAAARLLALATTAAALFVAWLPFVPVITFFIGLPSGFFDQAVYAAALALWCILVGSVLGIALSGRGVGAAVSSMAAVLIIGAVLQFPVGTLVPNQPTTPVQDVTLLLAHLSPHVLLKEALEMPLGRVALTDPWRAAAAFVLETALLGIALIQLQATQHTPARRNRLRRAVLVAATALVALVPSVAGATYEEAPEPERLKAFVPFSMRTAAVFLLPGEAIPDQAFDPIYPPTQGTPIAFHTPTPRDLLVLLPLAANATVRDLRLEMHEAPGMRVEGLPLHRAVATANEAAPPATRRTVEPLKGVDAGFVLRLPVTITLNDPQGFSSDWYFGELQVSYTSDAGPFSDSTAVPIAGSVPNGSLWMGAASLPAIAIPATASLVRSHRTRGG